MSDLVQSYEADWYEASLASASSGCSIRRVSWSSWASAARHGPHLAQFNLTGAFDDGIVGGRRPPRWP